ncbi:LysM peptidoglycan-binding domain-containing protein [Aliinostoc sp. HNIBRCY26]|uniref:LysM peptidoglycan-binding domain-containing protein n=1 Tax=Aliinostoc sp. HNIBRCY26 TaxID=3418997 RepID=UPI003CFE651B
MTLNLNCPVCSYQNITGDTCPNCDTDLRVIRMLQELPPVPTPSIRPFNIVLLILILIGLGFAVAIFWRLSLPQLNTAVVADPTPTQTTKVAPVAVIPPKPPEPKTYKVQRGDNLSAIAQKFCGQQATWQIMLKANPQLQGRENYIDVGEVLKIPHCQEGM